MKMQNRKMLFDIRDNSITDWGDEETFQVAKSHDMQIATVTCTAITPQHRDDHTTGYYDITFEDGTVLEAVSGTNLSDPEIVEA